MVDSVVDLREAVQEATTLPSEDVEELLDEDKCFSLTKPEEGATDVACSVRLSYAQPTPPWASADGSAGGGKAIKAILLHSEARVVEVCVGAHDEYLKTVHGKRLGQFEDTEMVACLVELNPPRQEVLLTLKHTYNPECVWVFGLLAVTTQEHKPACSEGRFSSSHLSSVLKDKEVNMSKDATRFLSLLESYNASNHASGQINENNQLALMSMFLGQKMSGKGQLAPGMLHMGSRDGDKQETVRKSKVHSEESNAPVLKVDSEILSKMNGEESKADKENTDDEDIESRMMKLVLKDNENNLSNLSDEPGSEGKRIDNTNGNVYKEQITPKTRTMPSARNEDGMIEKLFSLMGNVGQGCVEQRNTPAQHGVTKIKSTPPLHRLSMQSPQSATPRDHSLPQLSMMYSLMESLSGIPPCPQNNFGSPHTTVSGPAHSTPRSREAENNNGFQGDSCGDVLGLEGRGMLLKEIENMIDQKFAQMEERLTNKVEQKLAEKAQSDSARLEKIEEHLSKLCEHFLR